MTIRQTIPILLLAVAATTVRAQMTVTQSTTAPTSVVVISQITGNFNTPFAWWTNIDRNPRDKGQSFLVGAGGMVLDKITVKIDRLDTAGYDGKGVILDLFTLSSGSDFGPDSVVYSVTNNFPGNMKAAFGGGATYLTFDIANQTLSAGYYGFMLKHASQQTSIDLMYLAVGATTGYTNGIGINLETSRTTYSQLQYWTGAYVNADLQFYLQEAPLIDTTNPSMTGKTPVDNTTEVLTTINLVATFDETVQTGTGNITLKKTIGDVLVETFDVTSSARLTWGGAQVIIDPTNPLEGGVEYYVLIDSTAIKDVAGNFFDGISRTTAWTFTTDGTPPTIQTLSPTNGAVNVLRWANLVATFGEPIVADTGNIVITNLTDGTAMTLAVGSSQVQVSGNTLTINPSNDLSVAKHYAVLIDAGAAKDTSGNAFAGISAPATWSFTIADLNLGTLPIVNPSAEANAGAAPTGWTVLAGAPTAQTAASRTIATDDGLNLFMLYDSALSQTLGSTYQSGYTYTMSVDVAKRFETTGWGFGLYYDNGGTLTEVAKTVGTATWTVGTWRQVDLDLTVNAGDAWIGKDIVVKLFWAGGAYSTTRDYLDNVRLEGGLAPPVVIGAPETRAIYQRGTNNTASLSVTGTCLAGLDRIEVRALTRSGYKGTDMDWTTLVTSPGTSFSNTVELAGGWYDIEVRAISNGVSIATSRVDRVGIGDIFITCGQSNSANYGGPLQTPTDDRVNAFDFFMWQLAIDPQPNAGGTNGSAWPDFGSMLATRTEVPVAIIALGVGSTSVSQWLPGGYYSKILTAMNAMKPYGGFRAILWHQGETDSLFGTSAETYADRLNTIIAQSRTDAGFNVPWGVALASWHPSSSAINEAKVIAGQQLVIANDANVFKGAETDSFHTNGWLNDTVHFNDAGLRDHGRQWVDSVCSALLSDDRDNDGMSDLWMLMHFGHATGSAEDNSRAIDDADNDGVSNLDEYRATTDPKNRDVLLKLDRIELLTNATIRITWPAVAGRTYRVLSTEDLVSPLAWDISTPLHSYGSSMDYEESLTSVSARFFRVQAE